MGRDLTSKRRRKYVTGWGTKEDGVNKADFSTPHERFIALRTLLQALSQGHNNLIGTDFSRVHIGSVSSGGPEGHVRGMELTFMISHDALGKVLDKEVSDAIETLKKPVRPE